MTREPKGVPTGGRFTGRQREPSDVDLSDNRDIAAGYSGRDWDCLADIVAFSVLSADLVSRGKAAYDADVQLQLAGEAIMHRVGEAVSRISSAVIDDHPTIRFRAMKRARNLVAHNYSVVDPEIVWNTLETELPKDAAAIRTLLAHRPADA